MRASDTANAAIMRMARRDLFMMNRHIAVGVTFPFYIGCCEESAWCAGQAVCGSAAAAAAAESRLVCKKT